VTDATGAKNGRFQVQRTEGGKRFIIGLAFAVAVVLMAVKFYAYALTHSAAILSDALESIINVVASAFAMGSVILAAKPPDASHPYGHGKIEFFSAGFEGALIIVAALGIFYSGISHLLDPHPLPNLNLGLWLVFGTAAVNLFLGIGLVRIGRQTDSLTLIADGKHVLTDVVTSGGVLLGLLVVALTGFYRFDGLIACLVGINILITGFGLVRQSFQGLMDAADPDVLHRLARLLVENRRDQWVDIHQLRAWKSGDYTHVDLHLVLPKDLSIERAHHEAEILEKLILDAFGGKASALIHMDPCVARDCPVCAQYECDIRKRPAGKPQDWSLETLTIYKGDKPFRKKNSS
jgi:cation diffusion facilitator family transporter